MVTVLRRHGVGVRKETGSNTTTGLPLPITHVWVLLARQGILRSAVSKRNAHDGLGRLGLLIDFITHYSVLSRMSASHRIGVRRRPPHVDGVGGWARWPSTLDAWLVSPCYRLVSQAASA